MTKLKPATKVFMLIFGMGMFFLAAAKLLAEPQITMVAFLVFGASLPAAFRAFQG